MQSSQYYLYFYDNHDIYAPHREQYALSLRSKGAELTAVGGGNLMAKELGMSRVGFVGTLQWGPTPWFIYTKPTEKSIELKKNIKYKAAVFASVQ